MKPLLPIQLLEKYRDGKASEEEIKRVEDWYESHEKEENPLDELDEQQQWDLGRALYQEIQGQIKPASRFSGVRRWVTIAASIVLIILGGIVFWKFRSQDRAVLAYENTMKNIHRVTLEDGSQVWLYPGAKIDLDADFNQQTRSLRLKGVAFFQIKRDETRPFKIHSKGLLTQVLGTSFLIDASPVHRSVEVSVLTGKVRLQAEQSQTYIVVHPKQKVYYRKGLETKIYRTPEQDASSVWEKEDFVFDNIPLAEIFQALTQRFGVKFQVENEQMYQCRLTAHLTHQNLPDILEMIAKSLSISYEYDQNHVLFKGPGCSP
ncbi:FecR family protein [Siphonobacter sp. SORGH_AS_1065]|uniref:FecR family protein n=1 Tax=Siphonobacter sp. SORGH_AS_1065 TaxID=3041795 RepID=UPI00277FF754|nr:FecR family protein [Siphonobacter sp. SORGH_AS_1065]MDQ1090551.1 transmembrane sensor [Siphonobacter sp. SORGH_AS_1065]